MRGRSLWVTGAAVVVAACSPVSAPRQAEPAPITDVIAYESPREEYRVLADPDIGSITLRGIVAGRSPSTVTAPTDGRVLETFVENGAQVRRGDSVLAFLPAPSEAELIDLEIADLTIERTAAAGGTQDDISAAEQARDDLAASYQDRVVSITAPADGVITGTRPNVEFNVPQDRVLFEITDPRDLVVTVALRDGERPLVPVGESVVMTRSDSDTDTLLGTIISVTEPESEAGADVVMTVELDDPDAVVLGDRLLVALAAASEADSVWIPIDVVGRQSGSSYVLVADATGRLERRDIVLGRRTLSHVQVLSDLPIGLLLVAPS